MSIFWRFYRFDYLRYVEIRPILRRAASVQDLACFDESEETDAIAAALEYGEIDMDSARHALIRSLCCVGEDVAFDMGFCRLVAKIARNRDAEHVANLLSELLEGRKNIEPWLKGEPGLTGFLSSKETLRLGESFARLTPAPPKRRSLSAQLLGGARGLMRRLLNSGSQPEDIMALLGDLIAEAVEYEHGIAVYAG